MITIDLIRHAESKMNVDMADPTIKPFIGGRQNEVELSRLGRQQSIKFGQYAVSHNMRPEFIYSSPAVRCIQTATISGQIMDHGLEIVIDDRLQELDQGEWTNQPRTLYSEPTNREAMNRLEGDFAPPGGESMNGVRSRVEACLSEIALSHDDGAHIFVYTHGVAIKSWVGHELGWSHEQTYMTPIDNASFTRTLWDNGARSVSIINNSPL